jgi:hypothetical protein
MRHFRDDILILRQFCIFLLTILVFTGCNYTPQSDTNTTSTTTTTTNTTTSDTLEIFSAYYWDGADNVVSNDIMYIYFNKPPSSNSFVNPHLIYNIDGVGAIGTGSTDSYGYRNDFSLHRVFLDSSSQIVSLNETKISINPSTIEDLSGKPPADNNPAKVFKLFNAFAWLSTGDKRCVNYTESNSILSVSSVECNATEVSSTEGYLDHNQSLYIDQDLSSQTLSGDKIVKDNVLGLMWEDVNSTSYTFENANIYCNTLDFAGYQDWRIPNMLELQSIVDRNTTNPSLVSTFTTAINTDNHYWASNEYVNNTDKQWGVEFSMGVTYYRDKTLQGYVKCVRRDR